MVNVFVSGLSGPGLRGRKSTPRKKQVGGVQPAS